MKKIIVVLCFLSILTICSCTKNNNKSISSGVTQSDVKENGKISHDTAIGYAKTKAFSYIKTSGYDSSKIGQPTWGSITYDLNDSQEQYIVTLMGYCYYYNSYGEYTGAKIKFNVTVEVPYSASSYTNAKVNSSRSDLDLTYN